MFKLFASAIASVGMLFGGLFGGHPGQVPPGMPNSSSTPPAAGFGGFLQNIFGGGNGTSTAVVTLPYGPQPSNPNHGGWNASSTPPGQVLHGHVPGGKGGVFGGYNASSTIARLRGITLPPGWQINLNVPGGITGPTTGTPTTPPANTYSSGGPGSNHGAGVPVVQGTVQSSSGGTVTVDGTSPETFQAERQASVGATTPGTPPAVIDTTGTYTVNLGTAKVIDASGNPTTIQAGDTITVEGTITGTNANAVVILDTGPASS